MRMSFQEWQATGVDVDDLRMHSDVTCIYTKDEDPVYGRTRPAPGRMYACGFVERMDPSDPGAQGCEWYVNCGNADWLGTLAECERFLWDNHVVFELPHSGSVEEVE